jgi:cytoskeleton protein RodZ
MSNADDKPISESRQAGIGPGDRLQAARIQLGLSLDDVAGRMHLSSAILTALEENNFEEITAPIFVKGYLRAYARIVSLNEDEMIHQYLDYYSEEDPPISSTSNLSPELSAGDVRIKWTTYLVIFILGVLLTVWWWNREQSNEAPISLDTQPTSEAEVAADSERVVSEIKAVSEEPSAALETVAGNDSAAVPTASQVGSVEPAQAEPTVTSPPALATIATVEASPVPSANAPANTVVATANAELPTRVEAVALAPSGSDKLKVVVHADTWADIKDGNGFQMVYDLLRAEAVVELTGQAPFSVFLGNGHGVEIQYNGKAIEVAPRVREDNTARLKIGS